MFQVPVQTHTRFPVASTLTPSVQDCGNPSPPSNGQVALSSGSTYGSTATYSCDTGYNLVGGGSIRSCQDDAAWSGKQPTCQSMNEHCFWK